MSDNISLLAVGDPSTVSVPTQPAEVAQAEVKTLDKFTLFPKLPLELRRSVYRWSFPRGRLVSVAKELFAPHHRRDDNEKFSFQNSIALHHAEAGIPLPTTLFVNIESREQTLRHYFILFRTDQPNDEYGFRLNRHPERPFCFNPDLETLYATIPSFHEHLCGPWIQFIKREHPSALQSVWTLRMREHDGYVPSWKGLTVWGCSHWNLLLAFSHIETLEFVYTSRKDLLSWGTKGEVETRT